MKLVSFATNALPKVRIGLLQKQEIIDLDLAGRALGLFPYEQMLDFLDHQEQGLQMLQAILEKTHDRPFNEVRSFVNIGAVHHLSNVQLFAPIPRPRKNIFAIGRTYYDHAIESYSAHGEERPPEDVPVIFTKAPTAVNGPYGQIVVDPAISTKIDWEAELAVIIGKKGKNIPEDEALSYVFGYTVLKDVTARDLQDKFKQYFKG